MAGRPAASRGGDGMLYGMITFVVLTVASLGAFIWQLTNNKALDDRMKAAETRAAKFGNAPSYYSDEQTNRGGGSVADVMSKDIQDLAALISGKPDAIKPALEAEVRKQLKDFTDRAPGVVNKDDTLLTALNKLFNAHVQLTQLKNDLQTKLADREGELNTMANNVKTVQDEFEAKVAELKTEVERIQKDANDTLAAKDKQLTDQQAASDALSDELGKGRVAQQNIVRDTDIKAERLRNQIKDLQGKISELKPGSFDAQSILTKSDGQIMRAIPGSEICYISIGKNDGIKPGMKFEVFSPFGERMVDDYRGKATVEVATVLDSTSECKITRATPAKPVVEGDMIVNVIYEKSRKTKFVIRGDFDLNYDGDIDGDGIEKITAIIRAWGGTVVPEVDESVDFVVLGLGPQSPDLMKGAKVSSVYEDQIKTRQKERDKWLNVIEAARTRNIPILTQNQFLFLTGFGDGQTLAVR